MYNLSDIQMVHSPKQGLAAYGPQRNFILVQWVELGLHGGKSQVVVHL